MAQYRTLSSKTEIRVLSLLPCGTDGPICAELLHVDLSHKTRIHYEALSYTWGTVEDECVIFIDDKPVTVRYNLWSFLKRIQPNDDQQRFVWVDAICISQTDLEEKSSQVQMIGTIFQKAERVLAWLGEHSHQSERLFKAWPTTHRGRQLLDSRSKRERMRLLKGGLSNEEMNVRLSVWLPLLQRPYWNRTWIVQELVLGRSIVFYCGTDSLSWEKLIESRCSLLCFDFDGISRAFMTPEFRSAHAKIDNIRQEKIMRRRQQLGIVPHERANYLQGTLLVLSPRFHYTECTDPRDRVFALLSLVREDSRVWDKVAKVFLSRQEGPVQVDYHVSLASLFVRVCVAALPPFVFDYNYVVKVKELIGSLRVDQTCRQEIVDILLDDLDVKSCGKLVFYVLVRALDELDTFGRRLFVYTNIHTPSHSKIKRALSEWRETKLGNLKGSGVRAVSRQT